MSPTKVSVPQGGTFLTSVPLGSVIVAQATDVLSAVTSTTGTKVLTNTAGLISWESTADWLIPPIIEWYDPTGGLPADPEIGDRYGADATAEGWTIDYIYEWDGDVWVESEPEDGWMVWALLELMFFVFFSGGWMEVGSDSFLGLDGLNANSNIDIGIYDFTTTGDITAGNLNISNWNTAYGWGDHSTEGYLTTLAFAGLSDYPVDAAGALSNDGAGNLSWSVVGAGDMILAGIQSVTGLKTFDPSKLAMKGSSTGITTIATANDGATDYTATLQKATGTLAYLTDITGTNSGTNTGDQTSLTNISDTKANFDTACSDGNFIFVGDAPTAHAASHAVGGADTVLPADPGADRYLMWDDDPGELVWADAAGGASQLSDLSDVGVTTPTDKNALMADGDSWESRALVEADISDLGTYAATDQTFYIGTTQVAINRGSGALTLAGITLTTPNIGVAEGTSLLLSGLTASEILGTDADKNIVSLAVATYPSLTELSYVKGLSSAIQTQLGGKAPSANPTFTGTVILPKTIEIQDTSADHQYVLAVSELTADRIITLPLLTGADEFVFKDFIQTLTNKTLTKPVINATNPSAEVYTPDAAATATMDCSLSNTHRITMPAGNITIAVSNVTNAQKFIIEITQDGTGSRTVTWFAGISWPAATAPTLTTGANKRDWFGFERTGADTYLGCVIAQNL